MDDSGFPDYREDFERGDKHALLFVIKTCAECGWVIPKWAADAFVDAYRRGLYAEIESWEEVFGKPWGYDAQRRAAITQHQGPHVWRRVRRLHLWEGQSITNDLFDRVGEEFGLSRSVVSRLYYEAEERLKGCDPEERKRLGF